MSSGSLDALLLDAHPSSRQARRKKHVKLSPQRMKRVVGGPNGHSLWKTVVAITMSGLLFAGAAVAAAGALAADKTDSRASPHDPQPPGHARPRRSRHSLRRRVPSSGTAAVSVLEIVPYFRMLRCSRSRRWSVSGLSTMIS